ncbi:MAG: GNAT family N-acetyltransferase [Christensenellaceae bacterium]|jgi:GNAT superfamily N-acetyltransferase|nr:GNAT family N-acetyltransferase [Christensenellaceae bacterium]
MTLEIRPLTKELAQDFFDFHENIAFADHEEWSHCYCVAFHMDGAGHRAITSAKEAGGLDAMRREIKARAEKLIEEGTLRGYMAYEGGKMVGWCNANDKAAYKGFSFDEGMDAFVRSSGAERVKEVVCFCVAPSHRGKGVAAALLNRAVEDAKAEGFLAVEGHPQLLDRRDPFDMFGPFRLYEKAGFSEIARKGQTALVRKAL